jgi:hypothetical protein
MGIHGAGDKRAVIGTYGETERQRITIRRRDGSVDGEGMWKQVNREGNPLINELIIGTGSKDLFSVSDPNKDGQFAGSARLAKASQAYCLVRHSLDVERPERPEVRGPSYGSTTPILGGRSPVSTSMRKCPAPRNRGRR